MALVAYEQLYCIVALVTTVLYFIAHSQKCDIRISAFAWMPHPRNSFRVRWLSSHHTIWATISTYGAITRILITGDVLFASMSSVPLFGCVRYDHQRNAG